MRIKLILFLTVFFSSVCLSAPIDELRIAWSNYKAVNNSIITNYQGQTRTLENTVDQYRIIVTVQSNELDRLKIDVRTERFFHYFYASVAFIFTAVSIYGLVK